MSMLAKSKGEVTYRDISGVHKWFLIILISMGSSVVYTPMYLKGVFYDPLMQAIGCTNADLGLMVSVYGLTALICYLPSGIAADKFRMRTLATVGFIGTAVLTFIYATLPSLTTCLILFVGMGVTSILIWWGTRFKVIRLCCEESEYPTRIGVSYSIYGVVGLVVGLINVAIVASIANAVNAIQVVLVFLGAIMLVLGILSYFLIPDFKGEINKETKLFSLADAKEAFTRPGVLWACLAYFCVYAVYQGATYTTPYMTQVFAADGNLVNVIGLIRTYGIGLLAGPVIGWLATKLKSSSKAIVACFILAIGTLVAFMLFPSDPNMVMAIAALVVLFGFATYGAFSIGSSPLSDLHMPMRIFGTAVGLMSVIGFLPDVFIHTWYGSLIDANGLGAYSQIFGFETMFAVAGIAFLFLTMNAIKKHHGDKEEVEEVVEVEETETA